MCLRDLQIAPKQILFVGILLLFVFVGTGSAATEKWTAKAANDWYKKQPFMIGANFIPATAVNELEMWQADTFDAKRIDLELGWAESIGMNVMRVFLHDLLWKQDPKGMTSRMKEYLAIADRHHIKTIFVPFDSCWDPAPVLGKQKEPMPGIHNSRWVQSPGGAALQNPSEYPRLEKYVKELIGAFRKDKRIVAWDVWNEPDNLAGQYKEGQPKNKVELVNKLLPHVFAWARSANPTQPLTSAVWKGNYSTKEREDATQRIQLENSDIISYHNYDSGEEFEKRIEWLKRYDRPIICTEYMARGNGSTFQNSLPVAKKHNVWAINWGLVAGRSQTYLPWDSWKNPYIDREPSIWFHEVFRADGTPYDKNEVDLIRSIAEKSAR